MVTKLNWQLPLASWDWVCVREWVCVHCVLTGRQDRHTHTQVQYGLAAFFLCSCISSVREKASSAEGGGDGCHGYWFCLLLSLSLFLCFSLACSVCLSLRLLVLSVGVWIQGLVYELNPVALRCQESELGDGVGFKCSRLFHSDGHPPNPSTTDH